EEAEPLSRHVAEVRIKTLGPDNQRTLVSRINLALLYVRMGRWIDAEREGREVQEICHRTFGPEHVYSLSVTGILGAVLGQGDAKRAEPILREAVENSRRGLPEHHWRTAVALIRHGSALSELGRYPEAERELLEGTGDIEASLGTTHDRYRDAAEKLVELYRRWGRAQDAELWAGKLAPAS
ncbi:MAG: tetratricopeptide repeat protein, partial [Candidatus Eisenbacteria bacterium]|nr:tetratricopeptide repeat protein [Candidatus Eisenbacteria bacterium]